MTPMVPAHFEFFLLAFPNTGTCLLLSPISAGTLGCSEAGSATQGCPPKSSRAAQVGCVLRLKMKTEKRVQVFLFPCCSPEVLLFEEYSSVRETNRDVGFTFFSSDHFSCVHSRRPNMILK